MNPSSMDKLVLAAYLKRLAEDLEKQPLEYEPRWWLTVGWMCIEFRMPRIIDGKTSRQLKSEVIKEFKSEIKVRKKRVRKNAKTRSRLQKAARK